MPHHVEIAERANELVLTVRGPTSSEALVRVFEDGTLLAHRREVPGGPEGAAVLRAFAAALADRCRSRRGQVLSWIREEDAIWNDALLAAGFHEHRRKTFVKRDLDHPPQGESPFTFRTLAEMGDEKLLGFLILASEGDPFEDEGPRDYAREYADLLAYAGTHLDRDLWRVAYAGDSPVGVLLTQPFGEEGFIAYVGIVPEHRGRGYGAELHREGLRLLARAGAKTYKGSTDVRNVPMCRTFARNGCAVTGTQVFYRLPRLAPPALSLGCCLA